MKNWMKLPVRDRVELMRHYKENKVSYKDAIKDFETSQGFHQLPIAQYGGNLTERIRSYYI
jgi:hypothetical protein